MNKILTSIILCLSISAVAVGQLRFGAVASVGYMPAGSESTFAARLPGITPAEFEIEYVDASPVFGFGLYVQDEIGFLYFQSSLMLQSYQTDFIVTPFGRTDAVIDEVEERWNYLDWTVMAGLYKDHWRLGVGPVVHILADHESNFETLPLYNEKLRNITYGLNFGAGYNLGLFTIDLKYELSFRRVGEHIWYNESKSNFTGTPDILSLQLGFAF